MMTVVPPSGLRSASARSRATRSVGPPAAKGTTMVTGLLPRKVLRVGSDGGSGDRREGEQFLHGVSGTLEKMDEKSRSGRA